MGLEPSLRFDHFAYPVDDLVKAEDFYTGVLEIPIYERRGLRVRDVQAGTLPRTFLNVAGSRVGIFLGANRCRNMNNATAARWSAWRSPPMA